jgi:hypothetical protein
MRALALIFLAAPWSAAAEAPRALPPRGTYVPIGPRTADEPVPRLGPRHRILYVNRHGGTYLPGNADDSSENRSSIADDLSTIPPFHGDEAAWREVMDCVRGIYSPYAIDVVDEEPRGTTYIESVVGGNWDDLKGISPAGGVSPFRCETIERGINFIFSAGYGNDWRGICETIAQESGHTFGLEHEMRCDDPMTYLPACGLRTFQDEDAPCGEFTARTCQCSGATQNSHRQLLEALGPADRNPPSVALTEPREGETVTLGFVMKAEAADDVRIDRVEYFIDGTLVTADERVPYQAHAPIDLLAGAHTIEAVAVDGDENRTGQIVTVQVAPACATDGDCGDGRLCDADRCLAALGTACDDHSECASTQCYFDPDVAAGYCTVTCSDDGACPPGFACLEPEFGGRRCMPEPKAGGCRAARAGAHERRGVDGRTGLEAIAILVLVSMGVSIVLSARRRG